MEGKDRMRGGCSFGCVSEVFVLTKMAVYLRYGLEGGWFMIKGRGYLGMIGFTLINIVFAKTENEAEL